ncbi:MAG: ABC transporter substrate-binding protein [Lachnospiraceae bacterium]|nr:ABC transporter substrate-binding protein [Lachnospiraceae bacterium]
MKKKLIALLMGAAMVMSLGGCGASNNAPSQENGAAEATTDEAVTEAAEEEIDVPSDEEVSVLRNDLNIYSDLEPETLDLDVSVAAAVMFRNIYGNLYRLNSNNQISPELAEDYTANDDFTVYTFTLKDDLKFSDGSPLTSADAKYTFERAIDMGMEFFMQIASVETPDDKTIVITLTEPNNSFLTDVASEHMAIMSQAAIEGGMDVAECPNVTSGAYYVESWDRESHTIFLKSNPYFVNGEPEIKIVNVMYKLDEPLYDAMMDGTLDYVSNIPNDSEDIPFLKAVNGVDLMPYDNNSWNFIALNQELPHYADENVRRAISAALDLDYIIGSALDGQGTPAPLIITGSISGYLPGFNDSPYDVKMAKEYMAASAFPDGFTMKLEIGDTSGKKVAEVVKTLLQEINIDVEIIEEDGNVLVDNALSGNYDATFLSYSMYSGHISHAIPLFREGELHISRNPNTEIGDLMQQSLAVDEEKRDELLSEAYTLMRDKWPYVGLYWTTVHDAKVEGLSLKEPVTSEKYILANMFWEA